jgi:hypothetical protein
MPTWVRRTVSTTPGAFWSGPTVTTAVDCDASMQGLIEAAFTALMANPGLNCVPNVKSCMSSKWPTMPVDCCVGGSPPDHGEIKPLIVVCSTDSTTIQVDILRGLVISCGGHTLDVKAIMQSCFGAPIGTPNTNEFNEFVNEPQFGGSADERQGAFVIWNRAIGSVWEKTTTTTPGSFWAGSSTTTAKGIQCFNSVLAWRF